MSAQEVVTIGLSQQADDMLEELVELGNFAQKVDGYRFAFALAVAQGVEPPELEKRKTIYNVGSLDPDKTLQTAVEELVPAFSSETTAYRYIERLAEWGVRELHQQANGGEIDFVDLLKQVEQVTQ